MATDAANLHFFQPMVTDAPQCTTEKLAGGLAKVRCQSRDWEDYYRRRWQYDKVVRSTHGVNCTGSCSWRIFVKDGIIVWEVQALDYPLSAPEIPSYEPRGCPRGATYSWYTYSPVRIKYPLVRGILVEMWRQALQENADPVAAWASIAGDTEKTKRYKQARGKGGFVRVPWNEASEMIAAALIHTIRKYGPDRIYAFTCIPAMSIVGYISGTRFISLIGGAVSSFYDWFSDLPPASPLIWGDKTDVPESADWYNSTYMICWGTNIPMTRSPDAHFYTEARYRGAKVAAVSPDYAEYAQFADTWLPARAGTDGALAMAMTFVVLKEFYLDRQVPHFVDYARQFTDLPFVVKLKKDGDHYTADTLLRASELGIDTNNAEWKPAVFDSRTQAYVIPNGSIGFHYGEKGRWNLHLRNSQTDEEIEPLLTFDEQSDNWAAVDFPLFETLGSRVRTGMVPVKTVTTNSKKTLVTTVFDLLVAHVGVDRGHGGEATADYDDASIPCTPAWQEKMTGVPRADAIRVAREFAQNAEKTGGKSMIFLGSGTNHWYHHDITYRTIINLTLLCGCDGHNGGGWAHYTGQEAVRPEAAWMLLAFGLDWMRPPRQFNGTSFFYFATSQWRYERFHPKMLASPTWKKAVPKHAADCNAIAARLGWLPFYPQFDKNPIELCKEAEANGAKSEEEIVSYIVDKVKSNELKFAIEDPDHPGNIPRIFFLWRSNQLGACGKGHEYFLKHMFGTHDAVLQDENTDNAPAEVAMNEEGACGKMDLFVTPEVRMSSSALYSDVVLPTASWYEMHDLNTTDLHPFIHPFTPAVNPPWEAKVNWDVFASIAAAFSRMAEEHLPPQKDLITRPLAHDSPSEIASDPFGRVKDWKKGETIPIPGKTMPNLHVVTRDFPNVYKMMTSLGPLTVSKGLHDQGVKWKAAEEYEFLKKKLGTVTETGIGQGHPQLKTGKDVAEAILALSPETNGETAAKGWAQASEESGLDFSHLSEPQKAIRYDFLDTDTQPRRVLISPTWSGKPTETRPYAPHLVNIEDKLPFRTLTGRQHFYLDHEWMQMFGEQLPVYRPPVDTAALGLQNAKGIERKGNDLILRYLTPHSKWSIHSTYSETLVMMTLFRGGPRIWINNEDAASIGVEDNDWIECFNLNGLILARAVVSPRIPNGTAFMYHAQERLYNVPVSKQTGQRGGCHNSATHIMAKPTQMVGGYAQMSYEFNYWGPTGNQRDEVVVVRKANEVDWNER